MADTTYDNIDNPYNDQLVRTGDSLNVVVGGQDPSATTMNAGSADPSAPQAGATSDQSTGGSTQNVTVPNGGALADLIIYNSIQSSNWKPQKAGFLINGANGYAEFSNVVVNGPITALSGTIGGFDIGSDYIRDTSNSMGLASTVTGGDDVRFWAGATYANRDTAPFTVTESGLVTANNIVITGGIVDATALNGIISQSNLDVANSGWNQTCVFSPTDADTVSWGSGSFVTSAGTTYSISAGNTGNMSAKTYIYLDTNVSTTAYQTTTTAATAVAAGKVLIAVAQNNTTEATFQVFGGGGGQNIDASSIVSGSITANEIAASTITAGKMNVSQLSGISADLGAITAGTIVLPSGGYMRSGQTAYDTGTGFWIGNASGTPQFSIGNSSGNKLTWDGTSLSIVGDITGGSLNINNNVVIDSSGNATFIGISSLNMKAYTNFETAGRFISTTGGSGSNSFGNQGVTVAPGSTATSYSRLLWWVTNNVFTNYPTFTCSILCLSGFATSDGIAFIGLGSLGISGSGLTETGNSFCGFELKKTSGSTSLSAVQCDGGSSVDFTNSIVTVTNGDSLELFIKMSSGSIKYYYRKNGGTLTLGTTLTNYIPSSSNTYIMFGSSNKGNAQDFQVQLQCAAYEH